MFSFDFRLVAATSEHSEPRFGSRIFNVLLLNISENVCVSGVNTKESGYFPKNLSESVIRILTNLKNRFPTNMKLLKTIQFV